MMLRLKFAAATALVVLTTRVSQAQGTETYEQPPVNYSTTQPRDALVAVFTELACHEHMVEMHHGQNPRIDLADAASARGIWGLYYHLIDTRTRCVTQLGAYYEDEYRKIGGRWLISSTVCTVNSTHVSDLSERVAKLVFAGRSAPEEDGTHFK